MISLSHLLSGALQLGDAFLQIVAILLVAAILGFAAYRLRQPLIIAFIAAGILVGPSGLGWSATTGSVHLFAQLGLSILLFVVGLKLDIGMIRSLGSVALITGVGQIVFTAALGYMIALGIGMPSSTALYVAIAVTFSSTIIVVKLLSDKKETDSLHGRIAVGCLIVQDIAVVLVMIILSGTGSGSHQSIAHQMISIVVKSAAFLFSLGFLMYFALPRLLNTMARSSELLMLFAITWAVVLAGASEMIGLSREVGAFLAGVSLASTAYREIIGARLVTLRDFLLLFFFVQLGAELNLKSLGTQIFSAIPIALFALIGKPLIIMTIMGAMGYRRRTSLLTGLSLAQISEFSLILVVMVNRLGHLKDADATGLVTLIGLVGLITIGLSSYMIVYSHQIYQLTSRYLRIFERKIPTRELDSGDHLSKYGKVDIILYGLGRYGSGVGRRLIGNGFNVLGVDFDPQAVKRWIERGGLAVFGDAEDPEFPASLPLSETRWIVSCVRRRDINTALIHGLQHQNYTGGIAVTASGSTEARILREVGANVTFIPPTDAAAEAAHILTAADQQETRRKMEKYISKISDHYIICGYGRMGQQSAKDFRQWRLPYVVIEDNPEQLPLLVEQEAPHVDGKASDDKTLIAAGIERAKGLISVARTDEENVFIVLTARGLNPDLYIVARSILQENEDKLKRAGANRVISPYVLGGRRMSAAVLRPNVVDFLDLAMHSDEEDLEIREVTLSSDSSLAGRTIADAKVRRTAGVTVLAVRKSTGEFIANPTPDLLLEHGDDVIVLGSPTQLAAAESVFLGTSSDLSE